MKNFKKLFFLGVFALFSASCSKSNADPEPDDNGLTYTVTGSMTALVGSNPWQSKTVNFQGGLFPNRENLYDVRGIIDDKEFISLQFTSLPSGPVLNKIYNLKNPALKEDLNANVVYFKVGQTYVTKSGTFVITKFKSQEYIEGEMNLTVSNFVDKDIFIGDCKFKIQITPKK